VLAGGGAYLFKKKLKEVFTKHPLLEIAEPIFANVRSIQMAGQGQLVAEAAISSVAQMEHRRWADVPTRPSW
jgi:plasmid segregation protein ParM